MLDDLSPGVRMALLNAATRCTPLSFGGSVLRQDTREDASGLTACIIIG